MSATVRTSSRIQARKSRVVSTDKEPVAEGRKRKNSKDDETPAVPPTTPAKKPAVVQNVTLTSPSPSHSSAEPSTPTTASGKPANIVAISSPPATTSANATMATRSSQRGASSVPKEDVPSKPIVSTQPVVASAPHENPPPATNTGASGGQVKSEPASQASVGPAAQPAAQLAAQVLPPTHIFKNPNFTLSGRGGASAGKKTRAWKTLKQIITSERVQLHRPVGSTYSSIDAPPSRKPPKKYSDISGLPAKYTDPLTKLRYSTTEEFAQLRMFPQDIVNGLLALRRANLDVQ